jgi:serine protease Do
VLSPKDSPLGKQLDQYVCVRIVRMDNVDVGLFERDWNNAIYFFALNADEQIYLRYGGRDAASADTYLNLNSMELALKKGLELHRQYQKGDLKKAARPKPFFPREIPLLVERTMKQRACVECHLIGDYQNLKREQDGTLDKLSQMYRSPDIKTIGINLDVPQGLVVKEAQGAAQAAGMKPGDRISALDGNPVWTFGDLQYQYDKVNRRAAKLGITVDRGGQNVDLAIALPARWWWTNLTFRQSSVDPRSYFEDRPLSDDEKRKLGLKPESFASQVKYVAEFAKMMKSNDLRVGDVIAAVDGVDHDEFANTAELFIKLHKTPGDSVTLDVIRDGQRLKMPLKTFRMNFRK